MTENTSPEAERIDSRFPEVPAIEAAYRAAHRALEGVIPGGPGNFVPEDGLDVTEVISQFPYVVQQAEMAVAGQVGPSIAWSGERQERSWNLLVAGADLDNPGEHDFGADLDRSALEGPSGAWHGSSLDQAARAYRRAAGWDFAPGESGVWLLMLAPVTAVGGSSDEPWSYSGHLTGFVILYDRDEDGEYEAVSHIWTAAAWRRRGIALRLLQEAGSRFGVRNVERPYTKDGRALVRAFEENSG